MTMTNCMRQRKNTHIDKGNGNGNGKCFGIDCDHKISNQDLAALPQNNSVISLKGINKIYQTEAGAFLALIDIDLTVQKGEFVSVVGKSGSGKSTLINMLTGIDHPTDGEVVVANTPIRQLDEGKMAEWRGKNLGIVFQFFQLLPTLTVRENILLPMDLAGKYNEAERNERTLFLLKEFKIREDSDKFPNSISQGHLQRAAIARALANDPPILVADEPTGNLDSHTSNIIFGLFKELVENGKTILMVTHDDELASRAQRKITLADGLIVDEVRYNWN